MIEELCEYLVRHGYSEADADKIHTASYNDKENDLSEKARTDILAWKIEVGEIEQ
jgi:hypothetical protein